MAHYAADCLDAEFESSYGWIECVGLADRSAFDLHAHSEKSGVALVAEEKFAEPKEVEKLVITPVKKELCLAFKGNQNNNAPIKCTVFTLVQNQQFEEAAKFISKELASVGISRKIDITGKM
ncbi:unnamed protein product [Arabidopsis thaliana]|uniref:(thale cress) hypothetical protein n=1 Tax=Arabidopsis thaliana TaxID=3702 RepID=A0A7G2EQ92_ARATH|nr:unnamed protein product [Arabidopsis thaliana]